MVLFLWCRLHSSEFWDKSSLEKISQLAAPIVGRRYVICASVMVIGWRISVTQLCKNIMK